MGVKLGLALWESYVWQQSSEEGIYETWSNKTGIGLNRIFVTCISHVTILMYVNEEVGGRGM